MMLFLAAAASARTWTVDTGGAGDTTSLQAAIDAASVGDVIQINAGTFAGPFTWSGKDLTILGAGAGQTVLTGPGYGAVFNAASLSASAALGRVTLQNPGGVGFSGSDVSATFSELTADDLGSTGAYGGAFYLYGGAARFTDCTFSGNLAVHGGALYLDAGSAVSITASAFTNNHATEGGAILLAGGASLSMDTVSFSSNLADNNGGAIETGAGAIVNGVAVTFDGNGADTLYGGAIYAYGGTAVTLTDSTLLTNSAGTHGGAVYLGTGSTLTDTGGTWQDNVAYSYGGDVFGESTNTVSLSGSAFTDSIATYGYGGSTYLQYGTAFTATDTTWTTPYAYYSGGALYLYAMATVSTLTNVGVTGAISLYGNGGAIYAQSAQVVVDTGTFSQNEATYGAGGAIAGYSYVGFNLKSCTFEDNMAGVAGGAASYDSYTSGYGGFVATDSSFTRNLAGYEGGAISVGTGDRTELQRNVFRDNIAGATSYGGAAEIRNAYLVVARNNEFIRNQAGYGGAVYVNDNYAAADTWQNNLFRENAATVGGAGCWVANGASTIENNSFAGNAASEAGGTICLVQNPTQLRNNLVGWTTAGEVLYAYDDETVAGSEVSFNALWENIGAASGGNFGADGLKGSKAVDPLVVAFSLDNDADNDVLVLQPSSPLIDAGSPELLDPDGTQSDIGAYGGPYAWVEDHDGDGSDRLHDCDDTDATAFPGAKEVWYDGVDQDCDGNDDDRDEDGLSQADDCDDADPAVGACAEDTGTPPADTGCGCQTGGGAFPLALLALFGLRRRR